MMLHVVVFMVSPANWCPPGASEGDLIGKLDFCRCNQLRLSWFKVRILLSVVDVFIAERREGDSCRETGNHTGQADRGRGWSDAASGQETPGRPGSWRVEGKRGLPHPARAWPCYSPLGTSAYRSARITLVVLSNFDNLLLAMSQEPGTVCKYRVEAEEITDFIACLDLHQHGDPCGPTRCALGFWENLVTRESFLWGIADGAEIRKAVHATREKRGGEELPGRRRGSGSEARTLLRSWEAGKSAIQWARPGEGWTGGTGKDRSQQVGHSFKADNFVWEQWPMPKGLSQKRRWLWPQVWMDLKEPNHTRGDWGGWEPVLDQGITSGNPENGPAERGLGKELHVFVLMAYPV